MADENREIFREKVKFWKFSTVWKFLENRGGNLKQGVKCIMASGGWTPLSGWCVSPRRQLWWPSQWMHSSQALHGFFWHLENTSCVVQKNNFGQLEFCVPQYWNYTQGVHEPNGDQLNRETFIFQTETNKQWSSQHNGTAVHWKRHPEDHCRRGGPFASCRLLLLKPCFPPLIERRPDKDDTRRHVVKTPRGQTIGLKTWAAVRRPRPLTGRVRYRRQYYTRWRLNCGLMETNRLSSWSPMNNKTFNDLTSAARLPV